MADQSVKITNLPDSGSPEAVAFKLYKELAYLSAGGDNETFASYVQRHLALYTQCINAVTRGRVDTTQLK